MMKNKLLTYLGFAKKSGKLSSGEQIVLEKIKNGKAKIVFLASDASENTAKRIRDKANYRGITICEELNRQELGRAIGQQERVTICVNEKGFAIAIKKVLEGEHDGEKNKSLRTGERAED